MQFSIKNRVTHAEQPYWIVGDNDDYTASFTFDDEWKGQAKTARFKAKDSAYIDKLLEDDSCIIPVEVLKKGWLQVGVYSANVKATGTEIYIYPSIVQDGTPMPKTEDIYNQIMERLNNLDGADIGAAIEDYFKDNPLDMSDYATDEELAGAVAGKVDRSEMGYATNMEILNLFK